MGGKSSTPVFEEEQDDTPAHGAVDASHCVYLRCKPSRCIGCPELVVARGDLTACEADAIVNPASAELAHAGGVAGAIRRVGGRTIDEECAAWLTEHKRLPVGKAMSTTGGRLPARYVIHTVGPRIDGGLTGSSSPTAEDAQALRDAVKSVLLEAERLGLASVAMPGISSGIFGYPRDLAAREIVRECLGFCRERAAEGELHSTTLTTIVLMNIDGPTCRSFVQALQDAAKLDASNMSLVEVTLFDAAKAMPGELAVTEPEPEPEPEAISTSDQEISRKTTGMLIVRVGERDFEVLLGVEFRLFSSKYLTILGTSGVRTARPVESERIESCRRFSDDVGGLLSASQLAKAATHASRSVRIESSDLTLHIVHLDNERTRSLPDAYEAIRFRSWSHRKMDHLVWVPWRTLVDASMTLTKVPAKSLANQIRTRFGTYQLSNLVRRAVQCHADDVECHLEDLMAQQMILNEVVRIDKLKGLEDSTLLDRTLTSDWKLRLTSPPPPPLPPLQPLAPSDAEYKKMMAMLPSKIAGRVVTVRRVRASARVGEFRSHKQSLLGTVQEKEPLFHGTPERWRATAIALSGFDLGVY